MREKNVITKAENDIKHHLFEYLLLITSGIFFIVFLAIFRGQHSKQFIIASLFILYYVLWALIHHARDQSLHLKIVLEYLIIGALAFFVFRTLLFN